MPLLNPDKLGLSFVKIFAVEFILLGLIIAGIVLIK